MLTPEIVTSLESGLGKIKVVKSVGGGSINHCYYLHTKENELFCKVNAADEYPGLFENEKAGLEILQAAEILTPAVIACFTENNLQFLVMEWIEQTTPTPAYWKKLGESLANLHSVSNEYFGLDHANYMGSVRQANQYSESWVEFFIQRRLLPLIEKCNSAFDKGSRLQFEKLFKKLPEIFPDRKPSLLHGDLWSGNLLCNKNDQPVLIDPAVYYGHHSIDTGMTRLFGGFHHSFTDAYTSCFQTDPNFSEQCEISNLYPLLIHLYLFGGHYRSSIAGILNKYAG
jgi:protein-ribulosamine 3-kinase